MKKAYTFLILIMALLLTTVASVQVISQPDPPPMPEGHGNNTNPAPHEAPLNEGTETLLFLGLVYTAIKMYDRKEKSGTNR
jgi:hypothetical protein